MYTWVNGGWKEKAGVTATVPSHYSKYVPGSSLRLNGSLYKALNVLPVLGLDSSQEATLVSKINSVHAQKANLQASLL